MITDLILNTLEYPPLTTKDAPLEIADFDNNIVNIYNGFVELNNAGKIKSYNNAFPFIAGDYTIYANIVWRNLSGTLVSPTIGVTPVEGADWTRVASGELIGIVNSNASGLTAEAGGGTESATILDKEYSRIDTVASDGDSTKSLPAKRGDSNIIFNNSQKSINHFPAMGESIIGAGDTDVPIGIVAGQMIRMFCFTDGFWTIISSTSSDIPSGLNGSDENVIAGTSIGGANVKYISKKSNCVTGIDRGSYLYLNFAAVPNRSFQIQIDIGNSPSEAINLVAEGTDIFEQQAVNAPFVMGEQEFWTFYCAKTGIWRVK